MTGSIARSVGERYDRFADSYENLFSPVIKPFAEQITDFASLSGTIVDVGCGAGALADVWRSAGASRIIGVDASERMIRRAPLERCMGDATNIPLRSAIAEGAVSCFVLQHIADPVDVVAEMARVVRPSGIVATVTWGEGHDYAGEAELNDMLDEAQAPAVVPIVKSHHLVDSHEKMQSIFERAGLFVSVAVSKKSTHDWDPDHLFEVLTTFGNLRDRIASLSEDMRKSVLKRSRSMIDALPASRLTWSAEIVYTVGITQ